MQRLAIMAVFFTAILLMTGCLGSGDDTFPSSIVSGSSINSVKPTVKLNKTSLGASIRALLYTTSAQLTLTLNDGSSVAMTAIGDNGTQISFQATTSVSTSKLTTSGSSYVLNMTCTINGVTIPIRVLIPSSLGATTSSATTAEITASITLTTDSSGKITYSYTVQYIPAGQTTVITSGTTLPPTGITPVTIPDFYLEKVTYVGNSETVLGQNETSDISTSQPVFRVYFNKAISAVPSTLSMSFKSSTQTITFSPTGSNSLSASLDSSKKSISITVSGQSGSDKLAAATSYEIAFTSSAISADGYTASTTTLSPSQTYKIKTASSSTTTSGLVIDKITWYNAATAAETTLSSVNTGNVPFSQPMFRVYFNSAIKAIPATFSMAAGTISKFSYSDLSATAALSSDKKVLTLTIVGQATSSKLIPNSPYDLSFDSSIITADTNTSLTTTLKNGINYRVTTKKTSLVTWDAEAVNTLGAYATTRSGSSVGSGTTRIVLNFDYPVTVPFDLLTSSSYKFTKTLNSSTVTSSYKDFFTNVIASGSSIYQAIITGKRLPLGNYSISYNSGTFYDTSNNIVDTAATLTFVVQ